MVESSKMFYGRHFYILLSYRSLDAGTPKYDIGWNKNFTNFKGLTENKVDLAFSLKSRALQFANLYSLKPSSSYWSHVHCNSYKSREFYIFFNVLLSLFIEKSPA